MLNTSSFSKKTSNVFFTTLLLSTFLLKGCSLLVDSDPFDGVSMKVTQTVVAYGIPPMTIVQIELRNDSQNDILINWCSSANVIIERKEEGNWIPYNSQICLGLYVPSYSLKIKPGEKGIIFQGRVSSGEYRASLNYKRETEKSLVKSIQVEFSVEEE